jgi:hypothetical protein
VQAGRNAGKSGVGHVAAEHIDEGVPARAVVRTHSAEVAIQFPALEELGERKLLEHWRAEVIECLLADHGVGEVLGEEQPADPEPRRERLARGPASHHPPRERCRLRLAGSLESLARIGGSLTCSATSCATEPRQLDWALH